MQKDVRRVSNGCKTTCPQLFRRWRSQRLSSLFTEGCSKGNREAREVLAGRFLIRVNSRMTTRPRALPPRQVFVGGETLAVKLPLT